MWCDLCWTSDGDFLACFSHNKQVFTASLSSLLLGFLGYCGFSSAPCYDVWSLVIWVTFMGVKVSSQHNLPCCLVLAVHSFSDFQHLYEIRLLSESQSVILVTQHILNALLWGGGFHLVSRDFLNSEWAGTCVFVWSHSWLHSYLLIRSDPLPKARLIQI